MVFLFDKDDHKKVGVPLERAGENLWVPVGKFTMRWQRQPTKTALGRALPAGQGRGCLSSAVGRHIWGAEPRAGLPTVKKTRIYQGESSTGPW